MRVRLRADAIDRAIRIYEEGRIADAARLLARERRKAEERDDARRLAEIDDVVTEMLAYLDGSDRSTFDENLVSRQASTK